MAKFKNLTPTIKLALKNKKNQCSNNFINTLKFKIDSIEYWHDFEKLKTNALKKFNNSQFYQRTMPKNQCSLIPSQLSVIASLIDFFPKNDDSSLVNFFAQNHDSRLNNFPPKPW